VSAFGPEQYAKIARTLGRAGIKSPAHEAIVAAFVQLLATDNPTQFDERTFREMIAQARATAT